MNIGIVTDTILTNKQARSYADQLTKTVGNPHQYHKGLIAGKTEWLLAAPDSESDNGSKTWETIRAARTTGAKISIVYPSGDVMTIK